MLGGSKTPRFQALVIGAGAGGCAAASRLAQAGIDTLLIEEGAYHPAKSMSQDELEMIPKLFQERGQRATQDQSIMVMQGRGLGGGTAHNTGLCVPLPQRLWEGWAKHGVRSAFADFECLTQEVLLALEAREVPAEEINENNKILRRGAEAAGLSHFVAHHNRRPCSGCGFCSLGCAYNRKVSAVHAFLPAGIEAGLEVATGINAHSIKKAESGYSVQTTLLPEEDEEGRGRPLEIKADLVILAAGAVHNPLLLQESGMAVNLRCGRDLRLHPFAPLGAIFAHKIEAWRGVPQSILIDEYAHFLKGGEGGSLLMVAAAQPAVSAVMTPGFGADHAQVMHAFPKLAAAGVLVHDEARGIVRAGRNSKPKISYQLTARDKESMREGLQALGQLYFEQGAKAVVLPFAQQPIIKSPAELAAINTLSMKAHEITLGSVHAQGSCPIAIHRRRGTCDEWGQVFDQAGVFVADASLFPESLGIPPQVTSMAMGLRVADGIIGRQKELLS